ncbi:hypothetical protein D1871_07165 [Nakamurella silvestris]|nr:hypothetical protein D1871_07165 [Nakamurella silvestris]
MTVETEPTPSPEAIAYDLVLPPGWVRCDLRIPDLEPTTNRLLGVADLNWKGALSAADRAGLAARWNDGLRAAARAGVLDVYLPVVPVEGVGLTSTIGVSVLEPDGDADAGDLLIAVATADPSARVVEVSGNLALRTRAVGSTRPLVEGPAGETRLTGLSHQVVYQIVVPGESVRLLVVTLDVLELPGCEALTEPQIEVFDAIVGTLGWR